MNKKINDPLNDDINKRLNDERDQLPKKPVKEKRSKTMIVLGVLMFVVLAASIVNILASLLATLLHL
ncbi:hypothetical protein [Furfurilactobacillus siliginis]|uniref:Uncharacterized protein n=1 Tax=Furfurilactobacillus siliginis TaxID=348151 RepID=A0A0R2L2Q6_9LACO|nr:hypothetical protein [Furfurilactobacillus siliginis]KRN94118.1 hypothetical protein IV55_GL000631 [Furfurilactobacillus siliginis]GEK29078.1 hypothetical protein LSI01_13890 [Furfurilactobacillus siliginis]